MTPSLLRSSSRPTTPNWSSSSDQYIPLVSQASAFNAEAPMNHLSTAYIEKGNKRFLQRVEYSRNSTRIFWFCVGLCTGALWTCIVFVPILWLMQQRVRSK